MAFDWQRFLRAHGVPFVTRGPNVGPGQICIRCPWCGDADPSEHLSVSLSGSGYRCFRSPRAHAGKSRSRLIQTLLRCSFEEARRHAGEDGFALPEERNVVATLAQQLGFSVPEQFRQTSRLEFPSEFKPLDGKERIADTFWDYLFDRGYSDEEVAFAIESYGLRYAWRGPFAYRIIVPVYAADRRLMTWTGRTIVPRAIPRYKTLPVRARDGYGGPLALAAPGSLLLGLPLLLAVPNPNVLVLCEGPFDAIRVSALGHRYGVYGTCLFGLQITDAQCLLLDRLMNRFRRLVLALDPDARLLTLGIKEYMRPLAAEPVALPEGVEDPGALPTLLGIDWCRSLGERSYV